MRFRSLPLLVIVAAAVVSCLDASEALVASAEHEDAGSVVPAPTTADASRATSDAADAAILDASPACDRGLAMCGTTCVDTQTDNQNCGGCGLACNACAAGECLETIFADGGAPLGLAVDGTRAYWVDFLHFDVSSALLDGGDVQQLATNQVYPKGIAVDGDNVTWLTAGAGVPYGTIMRSAKDGGAPVTLANDLPAPQQMVLAANRVFWVNGYPTGAAAVMDVAVDGGAPTAVASASNGPVAVAATSTDVYWLDTDTSSVMTAPIDGSAPPRSLTPTVAPRGIAVNATNIFWTEYSTDSVMVAGLDGRSPHELAHAQTHEPVGIAVDDTFVYWTEDQGAVMKVPLAGGPPTILTLGQSGGSAFLVVDAKSVYWTSGPSVMKLTPK